METRGTDVIRRPMRFATRSGRRVLSVGSTELEWRRTRDAEHDIAVFHEFEPAPAGGGHQFLRALVQELEGRGLTIEQNRISGRTRACLFNSFNFDFARVRRFARRDCRLVHRVDGPIGAYRGFDDGTDARIGAINAELAAATVLQSRYSLEKHARAGHRAPRLRWSSRTRSIRRSSILPSGVSRSGVAPSGSSRRAGLRTRARAGMCLRGSTATSTRSELSSRSSGNGRSRTSESCTSRPPTHTALRNSSASTTSTSPRAVTTRARTHCSRRSRAGSRLRTSTAADIRSSSDGAACHSTHRRRSRRYSGDLPRTSTATAPASAFPRSTSVADAYLRVLGLANEGSP